LADAANKVAYLRPRFSVMGNPRHRDASHSLSAVVPFRGRDLIVAKGIDDGEMLAWAGAEKLLAF